ncbi:MAG TPA: hypothetical protein VLA12_18475, partial [Planctomycetaceae bacterium]|nr:hypothetical protein [Planctomycetaceae bacterium]
MRRFVPGLLFALAVCGLIQPADAQSVAELVQTIKQVDHEAAGNAAAAKAYDQLIEGGRETLPAILLAFNGANPLAENYLRSAFEVVA